jgi:hypothetical protein
MTGTTARSDPIGATSRRPARTHRLCRDAVSRPGVVAALVVLGILAVNVVLLRGSLRLPVDSADEQVLLVYPIRMLHGSRLYRDIFTAYGPGEFWTVSGVFAVTGPSVLAERIVGVALHAALAGSLFFVGRRAGLAAAAVAAATSSLLLVPLTATAYAWLAAYTLLVAALAASMRGGPRSLVVTGVLAGLATVFRPEVLLVAVALPVLAAVRDRRSLRLVCTGLAAGVAPLAIQIAMTPRALITDVFVDRIGRSAAASRLPIPPSIGEDRLLLALVLVSSAVCLRAAFAGRGHDRTAVGAALLALAALAQALQRDDWTHLLMAAAVVTPLAVVRLARSWGRSGARPVLAGGAALALVLAALFAAPHRVTRPVVDSFTADVAPAVTLTHDGRSLPLAPAHAANLEAVLRDVDGIARTTTTLFAGPLDWSHPAATDLSPYFLLPRLRQSAHQMEITPVVTTAPGSGLMQDLRAADVLVLIDNGDRWRQLFPYAAAEPARVDAFIAGHFCLMSRHGDYRVLVTVRDSRLVRAAAAAGPPHPASSAGGASDPYATQGCATAAGA